MAAPPQIQTRHVLFLPGFDPVPPRTHRERYRQEAAAQAKISGYQIDLSTNRSDPATCWQVRGVIDGAETTAAVEVLVWSDLVREAMTGGVWQSYRQLFITARTYLRSGVLFRLMRLRKGPVIAALYPVLMLILQAVLAIGVGVGFNLILTAVLGPWALIVGIPAGVLLARAILLWFKRHDGKLLAHYLMQDYAYSAGEDGAYPAPLADRLASFSQRVAEALADDPDELLIVGHSSGAYLAVTVLADALRSEGIPDGPRIGLLTLGQVVPMVSFLPGASRLRGDLEYLAASDRITWVDISAPGDGCAFALCDPVAVSGVAPAAKRWPLVLSAAFTQTLLPETWARLRWRFFRLHFQYLCAFDRPGDYDYFAISAGPVSLSDRFAGRSPSASRIEAPLNPSADHAA